MKKIRAKFTKCQNSKYISHLDLMRLFQRAFKRAGLHLKHTEGFNPQPKLAFATALSLGISSEAEYMDVELEEEIAIEDFIRDINLVLPEGVKVLEADYRTEKDSIASLIKWGTYLIEVTLEEEISREELEEKLEKFLSLDEIIIEKKKKQKRRKIMVEVNIRENIKNLDILLYEDSKVTFRTTIVTGSTGNLKPELLLGAFEKYTDIRVEEYATKIHRVELFVEREGEVVTPI